MPTVLLVRHGRTTANASGTLAGWTPGIHLDEVGLEQVEALGQRFVAAGLQPALVVSSPLDRCLETARSVVEASFPASAVDVTVDERLGECRYGAWTGRQLTDLAKEPLWRTVQIHPSAARFPDGDLPGESLAEMSARAVACVRAIDAQVEREHGDRAVWVAVSHGDVIKAILADAAGAHLDAFQRWQVDPASVSAVRRTGGATFVLRANDVGGALGGLVPSAAPSSDAVVGGQTGATEQPEGSDTTVDTTGNEPDGQLAAESAG